MISRSDLIRKTKETLRDYALQPNKNLGQNFCVEPAILELILATLEQLKPENILEIGGGLGTLSEQILRLDKPLTIVEKDSNLATFLEQRFSANKVKVVNKDVLQLTEEELQKFDVVLGNIPYEISSPLLFKIWSQKPLTGQFPNIVLTIQKEFALRLAARSGTQDYGRLSAMTQLFSVPKVLKIYPPSAFYPVPKVAHGVVHLVPVQQPPEVVFAKEFGTFMIALFNRKNKKVINSLEPVFKKFRNNDIEERAKSNELFMKRVKDVTPQECVELFNFMQRNKKN